MRFQLWESLHLSCSSVSVSSASNITELSLTLGGRFALMKSNQVHVWNKLFIPREFKLKPRVSLPRWKCRCQSSLTQRWRFRGINLKVVRRNSVSGTRNFSFDTPRIPGWNITALFHFHHHAYDLLFSCLWGSHDKLLLHSTNYLCHKFISGGTFVKNKLMAK